MDHNSEKPKRKAKRGEQPPMPFMIVASALLLLMGAGILVFLFLAPDSSGITMGVDPMGEIQQEIPATRSLTDMAVSPDGMHFAVIVRDAERSYIEIRSMQQMDSLESSLLTIDMAGRYIDDLIYSPDGQQLVATHAAGNEILIFDALNGEQLHLISGHYLAAYSPDQSYLALAGQQDSITLIDPTTAESIRNLAKGPGGSLDGLAVSPDGQRIALDLDTPEGYVLRVFDLALDGYLPLNAALLMPLRDLRFTPDGASVVVATEEGLIMRAVEGAEMRVWPLEEIGYVSSISFYGEWMAVAGGTDGYMRQLLLYRWQESDIIPPDEFYYAPVFLGQHNHIVTSLAFSPNGRYLLSASQDGILRMWDRETRTMISELQI